MPWESLTHQFNAEEIGRLETMPVEALIPSAVVSGPLVALRMLAELMLHEDKRLVPVLTNPAVQQTWPRFYTDRFADVCDFMYAIALQEITHRA